MSLVTQEEMEAAVGGEDELKRIAFADQITLPGKVASAISYAESTVAASAEGTPGYPWTSTPDAAKQTALSLAIYRLYTLGWPATPVPEPAKSQYAQALSDLKALADGTISWVTGSAPSQQNTAKVFTYLPGQALSAGNPRRATRDVLDKL